MDEGLWIVVVLVVLVAFGVGYALFSSPSKSEKKDKEPDDKFDLDKFKSDVTPDSSGLKGDLIKKIPTKPPTEPVTPATTGSGNFKKVINTLDRLYAKENGMWVCPICETLNEMPNTKCAACGKSVILKKNERSASRVVMER